MKILITNHDNTLVWVDTVYEKGRFRNPDKTETYEIDRIFAIKDDDRNKTVICSACGKEIPNTPAAIKAHQNLVNQPNKCFECARLKTMNPNIISQKYVLNDDGTYSETTKRTVTLRCNQSWTYPDINSEEARSVCKYARCETATFKQIEDFWTRYPGAFDDFITIDRVIDTGYKHMYKGHNYIEFDLKGRANLSAYVNNQGIVYNIRLHHRRRSYQLRYSKKYDTVWYMCVGDWEALTYLGISEDTEAAIQKKLKALYK